MIIRQEQTRLALPKIDKRFKGIFYADDVSRGQNAIIITMSIVALRRMKGVCCVQWRNFKYSGLSSHKEGQFPPLSRRIIINAPSFDYRRGTESTVGFITIRIARRDDVSFESLRNGPPRWGSAQP